MAAFDYVKARSVAKGLIEKFGQAGAFTKEGGGAGGYDDFGNVIPPEPDTVISGAVTPLLSYKQQEIDGEQIKSTDSYVFFHSEAEPPIGAKTVLNGDEYRVVDIKKLDSVDSVNVYRKLQLRR